MGQSFKIALFEGYKKKQRNDKMFLKQLGDKRPPLKQIRREDV